MDDLMSQVQQIFSELTIFRNEINDNKKYILYLKTNKIKKDNDIISLKTDVATCNNRIKESTNDAIVQKL